MTTRSLSTTWLRTITALSVGAALGVAPAGPIPTGTGTRLADTGWQAGGWQGTDSTSTGLSMTNVAKAIGAYGDGLDGTGVGIALVDTGVSQVPGLPAAHIVNGPDLSFESQGASVRFRDTYGHGTHMAGILVGNETTTGFKGLAAGAKLFSVKVSTAAGSVDVSQVIAGIDWVVQHRNDDASYPIRVLNLSYGTPGTQPAWSDPLTFAVENAWKHGIVVVVAGGNGTSTTTLTDPGYDPAVITVGSAATNASPYLPGTALSSFTDTSATRDVDITAPGQSLVSLRDPYSNIDTTYPGAEVGTSQFRGSGTSQAAAVVSGAVALLLQKRPTLTPDQVKAVLKATATPLTSGTGATLKLGFLNLAKALTATVPMVQSIPAVYGTGSLEYARGGIHVIHDNVALQGEFAPQGPFNPADWAQATSALAAWQGGAWMGFPLTGSGWTGTSWASKTWATTTWTSTAWYGGNAWTDSTWAQNNWTNGAWSGHYWSGRYWSSDGWSTAYWG